MHVASFLVALTVLLAPAARAADPWAGRTAAFFGLTWIDTSAEGEIHGARADETARLAKVEAYVEGELAAHGLALEDLAPVQAEIDSIVNPADCYGCDVRMAKRLGADYAIVGEVQKVSNLILSMNLVVRDTETGYVVRSLAVEIRGNTDESWLHGVRYILKHGIFTDPA